MADDHETKRPHNALFMRTFGVPENAASHLKETLPGKLVAALDWATLRVCSGSYVDEKLRDFQSDYLYEIQTLRGKPILAFVLFEHQRSRDPKMAFRLLRYMTRIWSDWLDDPKHSLPLPPIYPVVLYHGRQKWWAEKEFYDLIDVPEELAEVLGHCQPHLLYDLQDYSGHSDAELKGRALVRLTLFLFRHGEDEDFWQCLPSWWETMRQVLAEETDGLTAIEVALRYILLVRGDSPPKDLFPQLGTHVSAEVQETFMSYAQKLEQQGWERGQAAALQRSRARMLRQLEVKFGGVPIDAMQKIMDASEEDIDLWSERFAKAATIDEVLGKR